MAAPGRRVEVGQAGGGDLSGPGAALARYGTSAQSDTWPPDTRPAGDGGPSRRSRPAGTDVDATTR